MALIIPLGLIVLLAGAAGWGIPPGRRDGRSIRTHKQTVGTIERIVGSVDSESGDASNHVRLVDEEQQNPRSSGVAQSAELAASAHVGRIAAPARIVSVGTTGVSVGTTGVSVGSRPDAGPDERGGEPAPAAPKQKVTHVETPLAPLHMKRSNRWGAVPPAAAGIVILVAAIVVAVGVARSPSTQATGKLHATAINGPGAASGSSAANRPNQSSAGSRGSGASGSGASGSGRSAGAGSSASSNVTASTTTLPAVSAATATTTGYQYDVASKVVSATLTITGACWLAVRDGSAAGPTLFEATLGAGMVKTFTSSGSGLWLRIGAPGAAQLQLSGESVTLPPGGPYDITVTSSIG